VITITRAPGLANTRDAEALAKQLTAFFLAHGMYEDAGVSYGRSLVAPAAASSNVIPAGELQAFAGLAVRGVGFGKGREDGNSTVFVYVTKSSRTKERELLSRYEGKVRIKKVGRVSIRPEQASAFASLGLSWRSGDRTACGSSIGVATGGDPIAGTLGALLRGPDDRLRCLSNNHVIGGCNHTPTGQPILSPSTLDVIAGGPAVQQIATFEWLEELRSGDRDYVPVQVRDMAIAQVQDEGLVSSMQGNFFETPATSRAPGDLEAVKKVGRTTGLTHGYVESMIAELLTLPYRSKKFTATVNYARVWTVRSADGSPFALPGDSGSLVVTEDERFAVGLLFATTSDGRRAWISPMDEIQAALPGFVLATGIS
jgi:hypothetical protein